MTNLYGVLEHYSHSKEASPALWGTAKTGQSRLFPLPSRVPVLPPSYTCSLHPCSITHLPYFLQQVFIVELSAVGSRYRPCMSCWLWPSDGVVAAIHVTAHNAEVGRQFHPPHPHSSAPTPGPSAQAQAPGGSLAEPVLSPWYGRGFRGDLVGELRQTGGNPVWTRGCW